MSTSSTIVTSTRAERIRRRRIMGLSPAVFAMGVFMVLPLCLVVIFSFLEKGRYGGVEWVFDLDAYKRLLFSKRLDGTVQLNTSFLRVFFRSFVLAALTTIICAVVAFPTAYYVSRQSARTKSILLLLIMFPFWSNLLVRTTSWILILRDHGLINNVLIWLGIITEPITMLYTNTSILVGLVYVYIPFMILPVFTSVERLDFRMVEASYDLFASRFKALRYVILPLTSPGIAAGCILVFIPSLGAFITPDLLGGGKKLMLGSLIQLQFTSAKNWPYGAALSVLLMALVLIVLYLLARKSSKNKTQGDTK